MPVRTDALKTLRTLRHSRVLRVAAHGVAVCPHNERQSHLLVLDRPRGGALISANRPAEPRSEDDLVLRVLPALVKGLAALHGRGLVHRSLRSETIFLMD